MDGRFTQNRRTTSRKPDIISRLFFGRYDPSNKEWVGPRLVTLRDVSSEIIEYNRENPGTTGALSPDNPANFFKDLIRSKSRNNIWPDEVLQHGYTGRAAVGNGCFEFVPVPEGQEEAFPEEQYPVPSATTPRHRLQSASMPLASRRLGRKDEPWLMQVAVALNIIETHLAIYSKIPEIQQVNHLQMNVKLSRSEIDGIYLASFLEDNKIAEFIITVEAKGKSDDILPGQILGQVQAVSRLDSVQQEMIVPMAMKIVGDSEIFVVEFEAVAKAESNTLDVNDLVIASEAIYELVPPVPGIS